MSCQHFPPKHIFKYLVHQCWKLIQRCSLKVSLSLLYPLFQHMHRSMRTLKSCHSRKHVDGTSMCMPTLTLVLRISLRISFSHYCFFFSKPMYLRVTIEYWRNFRKLGFLVKNAFFFHQRFVVFSAQIVLHSLFDWMLKPNLYQGCPLWDTCFQTFFCMGFIW